MLPDWIDVCPVQLPGRSSRIAEPAYRRMERLIDDFVAVIRPLCDRPLALFGHSMGAAVAFAAARRLEAHVAHLFVAARTAPTQPHPVKLHMLSDAELEAYMRRLGGTPEIVFQEPEFMAHVLGILRTDLELNDGYRPDGMLARIPITAFGGTDDSEVSPERLDAWSTLTGGRFEKVMLAGNHFFPFEATPQVLSHIVSSLEQSQR